MGYEIFNGTFRKYMLRGYETIWIYYATGVSIFSGQQLSIGISRFGSHIRDEILLIALRSHGLETFVWICYPPQYDKTLQTFRTGGLVPKCVHLFVMLCLNARLKFKVPVCAGRLSATHSCSDQSCRLLSYMPHYREYVSILNQEGTKLTNTSWGWTIYGRITAISIPLRSPGSRSGSATQLE